MQLIEENTCGSGVDDAHEAYRVALDVYGAEIAGGIGDRPGAAAAAPAGAVRAAGGAGAAGPGVVSGTFSPRFNDLTEWASDLAADLGLEDSCFAWCRDEHGVRD